MPNRKSIMPLMVPFCLLMAMLPSLMNAQHNWHFEQIDSLLQVEERPVVVFLHTDWCRYCEAMQQKSFSVEEVQAILSEKYYFVPFDAESEEEVLFRGHQFGFEPTGRGTGVHSLAKALGTIEGELAYPSLVVLNAEYEIIFQYAGFMNARSLTKILVRLAKP